MAIQWASIGRESRWIWAALVWGALSLVIVREYRAIGGEPAQVQELWLLMSLLWVQFGFAALFADWRHNRGRGFRRLIFRTLMPPLVLHFVVFGIL